MPVRDLLSAASTQGAAPTDPYFYDVSLLLNGDGTNGAQNNTFTDSSSNNITLTRNGNLTQGSFNPYGTLWGNYFGAGDTRLSIASSSNLQLGSSNFTVEAWVYNTSFGSSGSFILGKWGYPNKSYYFGFNASYLYFGVSTDGQSDTAQLNASVSLATNTWYHLAAVRNGNTLYFYVNGTQVGTASCNYTFYSGSDPLMIGGMNGGGTSWQTFGYISNARLVIGTAVYTGNFTPSTTPLTAVTNTQYLGCQSNRFIDNSSNSATVSVNSGSPQVQPFSPFNPTSAYDVTTTEGSGYFSTSSYLSYGNSAQIGTNDFTWEAWFYPILGSSPYGGGGSVFITGGDGNGYFGFGVNLTGSYGFTSGWSSGFGWYGPSSSVTSAPLNQWYHLAVTRSSGNIVMYLNGQSVGTGSFSNSKTGSENYIGYYTNHSSNYDSTYGYTAGMRLVIGSVVYTGNFTPPTTPPSAVTNTALLPKFANAGIYDYATQNNLETVGNAQVSTSVKKYGTGSVYFDASGSYLSMPADQAFAFGTGDFTIEFWMNSNDVSSYQRGPLQLSTTAGGLSTSYTNGLAIWLGSNASGGGLNGGIAAYISGTLIGSNTPSLTTGAWYHIALVRQSGTAYLYVNGVSIASASNSTNITATNLCVGGYYSTSYLYNGYLDDIRITSGYARYPNGTTFTPPTAALPTF